MSFDAKAATPDTSLPTGAYLIGADSQSAADPSVYAVDDVVAPRIGDLIRNSPLMLPYTSGTGYRMVHPGGAGLSTGGAITTNRLTFVPAHFYTARTITEVGVYVGSAAASGVARLGLYENSASTGVPSTFVADFGEISTATTGYKSISISQAVVATKWYWWAVVCGTANPSFSCVTNPLHYVGANSSSATIYSSIFSAHTYGALPTSDQSGASYTRSTPAIAFFWI